MALNDQSKIGLGNRFKVTVVSPGKWELGSWAKADGLDVTWEVPEYRMGDGWNQRLFFPANTKYSTVKLTRAADSNDSPKVRQWLETNAKKHDLQSVIKVELCDSQGAKVLDWELKNIVIKKWQVTSMDAGSSSVAIETLEIDHEGFLDDDKKLMQG